MSRRREPPIAIIGVSGQLGTDLAASAARHGRDHRGLEHGELEIEDETAVERTLTALGPRIVINTAARHGAGHSTAEEQQAFFRGNALGPWHLARWCARAGALLVHYSTDYVFGGGTAGKPYREQDEPRPVNLYGASKLAGEQLVRTACPRHYVLRVASLYGMRGSRAKGGTNFVKTILDRARRGERLQIVNDQTMSPTSTRAIADKTFELLATAAPPGVYHMAGSGACTWYELALEVVRVAGLTAVVEPCATEAEPAGAPWLRPRYTALDNAALRQVGLNDLPPWRQSLAAFLGEERALRVMELEHARA